MVEQNKLLLLLLLIPADIFLPLCNNLIKERLIIVEFTLYS